MTRTKKLCAVIIDTLGREVMVRRPCVFGTDGWPAHAGQWQPHSTDWVDAVMHMVRYT
jgi:hypothetical protein